MSYSTDPNIIASGVWKKAVNINGSSFVRLCGTEFPSFYGFYYVVIITLFFQHGLS